MSMRLEIVISIKPAIITEILRIYFLKYSGFNIGTTSCITIKK
ncbi:hypothetical protein [Maridesulfovibrio sp.]|nr:hypothetical protein [Maridesulfovibrio sp.]